MKNLFIYISLLIAATTLAYSLAPVTVVLNNDGDNVTAKLNDYSSGSPVQVGDKAEYTIPTLTENGSGFSSFVVGEGDPDWGGIAKGSVNSNVVLDIYKAGTLIAQFRLDQLIETTARTERLPSTVSIGKELTVAGEIKVDSTATFAQKVEVKGQLNVTGVLRLASNKFKTRNKLGDIESNIMIFNGTSSIAIVESDFSNKLVNGASYTIINNGGDSFSIELDNGGLYYIYQNQVVTIIKIGGVFYYVATPGFQGG